MAKIAEGDWDDSIEAQLGNEIAEAIDDFGPDFDAEGNPLEEGESDRIRSGGARAAARDGDGGDGRAEDEDDELRAEEREQEAGDRLDGVA